MLEDLIHFVEHFGAAEFGDDEVVGEEGVTEGFVGVGVGVRVRVQEEVEGEVGVFLEAEEGSESEW